MNHTKRNNINAETEGHQSEPQHSFWKGHIKLFGPLVNESPNEIRHLVERMAHETIATHDPDLHSIVKISDDSEILTTDAELAERIGKAIMHSYKGQLDVKRSLRKGTTEVVWRQSA